MNMMKKDVKRKVQDVNGRNWWKFSSLIEQDLVYLSHHVLRMDSQYLPIHEYHNKI